MGIFNFDQIRTTVAHQALVLMFAILMSACTTTESSRTPAARIEIQAQVGFTIKEEARISSDVRMDYANAIRNLEQGDLGRGIDELQAIVDAAPQLVAPRVDLGIAYHLAGDLVAAEDSLLAALDASPGHPIAHNELGVVYRKSGRFTEARKSYEAALATYPGYHYARRNLAILCDLYLADLNCALANYEAYMATVPGDAEASMWIKDLRYRISQGER